MYWATVRSPLLWLALLSGCGGGRADFESKKLQQPTTGSANTVAISDARTHALTRSSEPQACVVAASNQDTTCKESIAVGPSGQNRFSYFRSFSLQAPNSNITRAVIVVHGMGRDADAYFRAVVDGLHNSGDPSLLVIAPHFPGWIKNSASCHDTLDGNDPAIALHWSCTGADSVNRWDDGGLARDTGSNVVYSFSMVDMLLTVLNDQSLFPNLQKITIAGHSAGAQFTQRYAAGTLSDGDATTPIPIKYVVASPGSYMYLDNARLPRGETCFSDGRCTAPFTTDWDADNQCPTTYNAYKYGLENRRSGYLNGMQPGFSEAEIRDRFLSRNVAYLPGENDTTANSSFDQSCEANAQGSQVATAEHELTGGRRERATIFWSRMRQLGAAHSFAIIPGCDHTPVGCTYAAQEMIDAILY